MDRRVENDWKLIWSDEFDGTELDPARWNRQVEKAGRFNKEWQYYTDDSANAYIDEGQLVIEARHHADKHGPGNYSSARLNTAGLFSFCFGRLEARIKLPHGKGLWPALWMLGANCSENGGDTDWPFCGEIDILELYGSVCDATIETNIHYAGPDDEHRMLEPPHYKLPTGIFADDFHVFSMDWDEECIVCAVDGIEYTRIDIRDAEYDVFRTPHFILMNIALGGISGPGPDASTSFPQRMTIDWIRVYQRESIKN